MGLRLSAPAWESVARDGDLEQLPPHTELARGEALNRAAFPGDLSKSQFVLIAARANEKLSRQDRQYAIKLGNSLAELLGERVIDIWHEKTPAIGPTLLNRAGNAVRVVVRLNSEFMATENIELLRRVEQVVDEEAESAPAGLQLGISGSAAIGGDMLTAAAQSVLSTHRTTILLVTLTLLIIYRSPTLVLVPLIAIAIATSISFDVLTMMAYWSKSHPDSWPVIHVFTTTKIFVIVLLFGSGTDYCLFLTARFREMRLAGESVGDSLVHSVRHVGIALVASALTTIVGLAMMGFADYGKFAHSGPTIAVCLAIALMDCLTLVPALLATSLGRSIRPGKQGVGPSYWNRFWERLAERIDAKPARILAASCLVATPLAWHGTQVETSYDLLEELANERVSKVGTDLLRRYFPVGELGPVVVLAELPGGELDSTEGQFTIAQLAKPLDDLPGVHQVRSLYQPLGDPPGSVRLFSSSGLQTLAAKGSPLTKAIFVSHEGEYAGNVTRLFLTLTDQPFSLAAIQTCASIEQALAELQSDSESPWRDANFALAGPSIGIREMKRITQRDRLRIQVLVTLAVLVVIVILLRRVAISLFLIFSVLLSYFVTIGITDLVFALLRGPAYVGLDWTVPIFLFVLLVAVGQDYNIYLVSRVLEEQRTEGLRAGLRRAVTQTGGIITSCGIIMAGTFVSMTTAQLNGMVELGFSLTLGILIDTLLVRTIFVPAFLSLLARREQAAG